MSVTLLGFRLTGALRFAAADDRLADLGAELLNLVPSCIPGVEMFVGVVAAGTCGEWSNMFMSPSTSKLKSSLANCPGALSKENDWNRVREVMDDCDGE
ncbi:hypothetical protein OGATHE_004677 [Ogataea polymorpha]|uniref:Uncharacterized protein n=1 Tax=Ogataea polymorpha TaxID=460523 RepID=A0A9P8P181_9ASCO|nr:hypothetical protein OGATHE_004677 [Ogataea polymorpha]